MGENKERDGNVIPAGDMFEELPEINLAAKLMRELDAALEKAQEEKAKKSREASKVIPFPKTRKPR